MSRSLKKVNTKSKPTIAVHEKLSINLLRKAIRERRKNNDIPSKRFERKKRNVRVRDDEEHGHIVRSTEAEICRILASAAVLPDIPFDYTAVELQGEIALAHGAATRLYIQRDGLSTLTIMLPQTNPTITNLKRAIECVSRAQLQRELRERHEERQKRRHQHTTAYKTSSGSGNSNSITSNSNSTELEQGAKAAREANTSTAIATNVLAHIKSTGELVYSTASNGHQHRSNVSWRFLWRAFALFDLNINKPLDDHDGNKLLSEHGIENGATLKFCKREKYFGRKRQ